MRLLFIIGSHRTGTKLLGNFFGDNFEGVNSVHQYGLLRWVNILSNLRIAGKISESAFRRFLKNKWADPILRKQLDLYVESNGFNYLSASYMQELHDDVRIVHMIRDPRDYVVSYTNWIEGRAASKVANMVPYWHVSGPAAGLMSRSAWRQFTSFEKFCWYWSYMNQLIEQLYQADGGNYLAVKFEDLTGAEHKVETLKQLLAFSNLNYKPGIEDYFSVKQNESKGNSLKAWSTWNKAQAKSLHEICGLQMRRYGYGNEPEWKNMIQ